MNMNGQVESFISCIHSEQECVDLIHAAQTGQIGRIRRRLNESEKTRIRPGSIFVYKEEESGIRRWTDKREWTPSRVQGIFLVYRDLNGPLIKKTYGCTMKDGKYHVVAYTLMEWESDGKCCEFFKLGGVERRPLRRGVNLHSGASMSYGEDSHGMNEDAGESEIFLERGYSRNEGRVHYDDKRDAFVFYTGGNEEESSNNQSSERQSHDDFLGDILVRREDDEKDRKSIRDENNRRSI